MSIPQLVVLTALFIDVAVEQWSACVGDVSVARNSGHLQMFGSISVSICLFKEVQHLTSPWKLIVFGVHQDVFQMYCLWFVFCH